jgi:hypothetical protein
MMMQRHKLAAICFVAALGFSGTGVAYATTLMRMSIMSLSRAARAIVRARCVANETRWDAGEIVTFTNFDVEEIWKGSPPARLTVRLIGGHAGTLTSTVSGVPRFAPGEEVVLFLEQTSAGDYSVVSWVQGTFRIERDNSTGDETITQDTAAFPVFDPASHRFDAIGVRKMRAESFREMVTVSIRNADGRNQ